MASGTQVRWDETWHRLLEWTNGSARAERLAGQLLLAEGYKELDPSHPLGGPDGVKDAIATKHAKRWVMAVYFPRGQQTLATIRDKLLHDLGGVAGNAAHGLVFVTNQELTLGRRRALTELGNNFAVELYHLERVTAVLDQPHMHPVREQFLQITEGTDSTNGAHLARMELHRAAESALRAALKARMLILEGVELSTAFQEMPQSAHQPFITGPATTWCQQVSAMLQEAEAASLSARVFWPDQPALGLIELQARLGTWRNWFLENLSISAGLKRSHSRESQEAWSWDDVFKGDPDSLRRLNLQLKKDLQDVEAWTRPHILGARE